MSGPEATAAVFLTALRALPKKQRDTVFVELAKDAALVRDLMDLAVIAERRREPSRPFRAYLKSKRER